MTWRDLEAEVAATFADAQACSSSGYLADGWIGHAWTRYQPSAAVHCRACGVWFSPLAVARRYCSDKCFSRRDLIRRRRSIHCRRCGIWFTPLSRLRQHCDAVCQREAKLAHTRHSRGALRPAAFCRLCGAWFTPLHRLRRYCGPLCERAASHHRRRGARRRQPAAAE